MRAALRARATETAPVLMAGSARESDFFMREVKEITVRESPHTGNVKRATGHSHANHTSGRVTSNITLLRPTSFRRTRSGLQPHVVPRTNGGIGMHERPGVRDFSPSRIPRLLSNRQPRSTMAFHHAATMQERVRSSPAAAPFEISDAALCHLKPISAVGMSSQPLPPIPFRRARQPC